MTDTCLIWLVNKIDKICKPTGEKRVIMTMESVKNVTKYIKLPVILFHEDMTEKMKEFAQDILDHESTIEIKLDDGDLLHLAKAAHERNITLNQLCNNIIKGSFDDLDYRFEHSSKPVVLSEY